MGFSNAKTQSSAGLITIPSAYDNSSFIGKYLHMYVF